jgi:hypothetical protein
MKAREIKIIKKKKVIVTTVFQDGTDLEEELGLKCHHRVYNIRVVEPLPQVG